MYTFTDQNKQVWSDLFLYFIGSVDCPLNLNKGIALTGSFGIGKSTIFRILHDWMDEKFGFKNPNTFRISSTEEVVNVLQKKDWMSDVLVHNVYDGSYGFGSIGTPKPINILINEFAYQYDVKHYGTNIKEYIEMFIMKRYDIFQQYGKLTHVTMNFDPKKLDTYFSPRIVDRFAEMFNFIEITGKSFRK